MRWWRDIPIKKRLILDLCSGTGAWSKPYRENGYRVITIDTDSRRPQDVRLLNLTIKDFGKVYGILAAPPCTVFASSGARWWKNKGEEALLEGLSIVDACLRIVVATQPTFWALENPVGRLKHYLGKPVMYFHPCDYGDPYTKRTCLWGKFNIPKKFPVKPILKSPIHYATPSPNRSKLRSITPPGFAKAFFEANK